jgi:hypothetical protein
MTSWTALLDAIDEGLMSSPPVLVDFVPADFGPLPVELAARAGATLQRMITVEAALERDRAELAGELAAISAALSSGASNGADSVPHFLDTKA